MPSSLSVFGEDRQASIALAPINFDVCCLHHLPTLPVLGLIRCGSGGAAIILIMTRWHEDDLASRLLAEADPTRGLDCGSDRGNT